MDKKIVIKSLLNGIISLLVLALLLGLVKDQGFVQALTAPYTIAVALVAIVGSYIGFARKAKT
jgi:hypothetical protein